ncbi:MAG: SAM-dependent methyltransferase [Bacteroidota bacterium]
MKKSKGILYLIPVNIGGPINESLPTGVLQTANSLDEFIVENERTARRFLISAGYSKNIDDIKFHILNKHTSANEIPSFLNSLKEGKNVGILSEAGCPCIADPGQIIVDYAQKDNIKIKPLIGPNSMILALMASGMNGQSYTFTGYLPIDKTAREKAIREMENTALRNGQTQIFMETPFRNNKLIEDILRVCKPHTKLCIAADVTMETEFIVTKTISEWKKNRPDINKRPAVFLINK